MKKIFKYLNIVTLMVALSAVFAACSDKNDVGDENLGLHIKVFAPTAVIPGTSMTINGGGFNDVTEIVFPGDIVVKDFEIVTNEMIRVKAPAQLTKGGTISVRNKAGETAVSRLPLTVGHTEVTGCASEPGDHIKGKDLMTFYGKDMQFVVSAEFIDENGDPIVIDASEFYRVAPGRVVIQVPAEVITGNATVKIYLPDGTVYESDVFEFETNKNTGGGHWEYHKKYLWKNEDPVGNGAVSWNGLYRFSNVETVSGEQIHAFTMEEWALIKDGTIFFLYEGADNANVRVTTGWWTGAYGGTDYNCAEIAGVDDETGMNFIELNFKNDGNLYDNLDAQHLLFTGDAYTPMAIYIIEAEWVDGGGGHMEKVRTSFWKNGEQSTIPAPSWSGEGRFARESSKTGEETYAFTDEDWEILKSEPFRIAIEKTGENDPNVRITTGWWTQDYGGKEYNCFEIAEVDEATGLYFIELNLKDYPEMLELLDAQHLLFTGSDYKLIEIYQEKEIWVEDDGEDNPKPVLLWENPGLGGISWNGTYRFANVETVSGEECHAFSLEEWAIIKDGTFYLEYEGDEGSNVRITTGWWTGAYGGTDHNCIDMAEDGPNGHKIIKINIKEDGNLYDNIDVQHFLLTGDAYVPVKLYYYK